MTKYTIAFLIALFTLGVGCGPIPAPKPAALRDIAVIVTDQGQSLPSAVVTLGTLTQATGPDGVVTFHFIPAASQTLSVTVSYPGCQPYTQMVTLAASINQQIDIGGRQTEETAILLPALNCHVDPSTFSLERLAQIRGAMWTARLNLPYGPRPNRDDNILPMVFYEVFSPEDRERMLTHYHDVEGYTHAVTGPITGADCYHEQYPCRQGLPTQEQWDAYLDTLQEWWDAGIIPIFFGHPDGWTFEQTRDALTPLLSQPRAQKLIRIFIPSGWEPTRFGWSSCTWAAFAQWGRETLPNALIGIHTTADVDAPAGSDARCNDDDHTWNPDGNAGAWRRVAPYVHLWLIQNGAYQDSPAEDPTLARNFAAQFKVDGDGATLHSIAWHFAGHAGWPTTSAWGNSPVRLINAEVTSFAAYWANLPESISRAWGDLAIASGAAGYLDGGTVAVP